MSDHTAPTQWWAYVERGLERAGITQSRLADLIGMTRANVSRWNSAGVVPHDPEIIRNVARILDQSVIDGLFALGYLNAREVERFEHGKQLIDYTSTELLDELHRRTQGK